MRRKGALNSSAVVWGLASAALALVVFGLISAYGSNLTGVVADDIGTRECASEGYTGYNNSDRLCYMHDITNTSISLSTRGMNSTAATQEGIGNMTDKSDTLGTIIIAGAIIFVLISAFMYAKFR